MVKSMKQLSKLGLADIYGLVDPDTGQLRYVGQTGESLGKRLSGHLSEKRYAHTHKARWIASLKQRGLKPAIILIQEVDLEIVDQAEEFWIGYFKEGGHLLTNLTDGGSGMRGWHHPDSALVKMSVAKKGKKTGPMAVEIRKRIATAKKGRPHAPEHAAKCRVAAPRTAILDQNGVVYPSISEAARKLGLQRTCIRMVLAGHLKTTGNGYSFTRVD